MRIEPPRYQLAIMGVGLVAILAYAALWGLP